MAVSFGNDWFSEEVKRRQAEESRYVPPSARPRLSATGARIADIAPQSPSPMDVAPEYSRPDMTVKSPSPMDMPKLFMQGRRSATPPQLPSGGGGPSVSSVFAPLFDALNQQRKNAESRYGANAGQIQNIFGQIIGARRADVDDIQEAYSRLQAAAAARGESTLGKMEQREMQRQSEGQQVLESMGVGDIAGATDDVAAQSAAVAQDVELMNQSNWAGMLDVMGKTSEEIARADVTSYGYRQMEDIAKLQAAKEDYLENVAQQEFQLKFEEQQAKLAAAQAAAQAQAEAQAAAAKQQQQAQEQQFETFMRYSDPLTQGLVAAGNAGLLSPEGITQAQTAYDSFMQNIFNAQPPSGMMQWNGASAAAAFRTSSAAQGLDNTQKNIIAQAIRAAF